MKEFAYPSPIQVIGKQVIVDGQPVDFPEDLKLNKEYVYTGQSKLFTQTLTVKRVNLSSIDYQWQVHKGDQLVLADSGQAHLRASFFLASEVDNDDQTGDAYGASEYVVTRKDCSTEIRIGMPEEEEVVLKATASSSCNPAWKKVGIPEGMTLRTKKVL
ncbi:hypothetical protein [Nibribacter koreensis]|uniref:Uncharacterized protein n=1 Tax=Nibribacter koreensis TaxID=1084519 RepID=A0ABP8FUQ1_9BACT